MTTISFKAEVARLNREAERADNKLTAFIVTLWCWVVIFGTALACVEVLL
jgi:L-fucose isomerase-like protein